MKKISLFVVLALALVSACSSAGKNGGENGANVPAVSLFSSVDYTKANYSPLSGKSKIVQKPTLIKLGIRPIALTEARGYMYSLFESLVPELEKTNITYQMAGNDIVLTIQSHILLDDKMELLSSITPQLDNIIALLVKNDRNFIEIVGHTSSVGPQWRNQIKSENMAIAVGKYFMNRGIIPQRMFMAGMGENHWIADNSTREGRLLNHRIEIKISPLI